MRRAAVVGVPYEAGWIVVSANAGLERRPSWAYNLDDAAGAVVYERGRRTQVTVEHVRGDSAAPLWTEYLSAAPAVEHYQRMAQRDFDLFVLRNVDDEATREPSTSSQSLLVYESQRHLRAKPARLVEREMSGMAAVSRGAKAALIALGAATFAFGVWAFVAPHSFFMNVAHFEPYNRHFTHDAGALQMGVGASLLLAVRTRSGEVVALGGFVVFQVLHVASHVMDRNLGGKPWLDIPFLGLLAVVGIGALRRPWSGRSVRARGRGAR